MKTGMVSSLAVVMLLGLPRALPAQHMDPDAAWPLCGRITEKKPKGWRASKGCPSKRFGNPAYTDAPYSSTFGPRPLASEGGRYDFHRGVDIATPSGTPIFAVTGGSVEIAGSHPGYSDPLIKLRHYRPGTSSCTGGGGCYHSFYLHIGDWVVGEGDWVEKGELIGYTGASGASGFEHLHFEVRDAPPVDAFSAWQRDSVHPFALLPYVEPNLSAVTVTSVDGTDPMAVAAEVDIVSNRYDLVSVEMAVFDAFGEPVEQPGATPDARGYHVMPPFFDMEVWNFEYSHKDSAAFPWEEYGAGGLLECPFHLAHGAAYDANTHMDAQHPESLFEGLFNGVRVVTDRYWLNADRSYRLTLGFLALKGPAACVEATAVFASGDLETGRWGDCGSTGNEPPQAAFGSACTGLDCSFDGSGSFDPDGALAAYEWDFGDGSRGAGVTASHRFAAPGSYAVALTVTDDRGAADTRVEAVTVADPGDEIAATVSTNRKRNRVFLSWSGAAGSQVDIHRNGSWVDTTANDGGWNDREVSAGNSYRYRVCEAGSLSACSNEASIDL